jgi:predicted nucleotidyltransferase
MSASRDPYLEALQAFSEDCKTQFRSDVLTVYVMGSVARNEHIIGKSDIEMVCVLKREDADIQRIAAILESFKETMKEKGIPNPYLEILRPSEYERAYLFLDLFSTYDLKMNGKIVYGEDIGSRLIFPSGKKLKELAELHILSIRQNAYIAALSCGPNLDSIPDEIIEDLKVHTAFAAGVALIGRGVMVSLKREILSKFTKTYPKLGTFDDITRRANENPPETIEEKKTIVKKCLRFLDDLCAVYSEHIRKKT